MKPIEGFMRSVSGFQVSNQNSCACWHHCQRIRRFAGDQCSIENIASQTILLSMNASIAAVHAGESGNGFAEEVVEIKKLAESSSEQSKTMRKMLT
jgi:hypothetical protein